MSRIILTSRENEILRILQLLYAHRDKFTLIGGYAVDAYSPLPRFSVDCDLVTSKSELNVFSKLFNENGFTQKSRTYRNRIEGIETWKFNKIINDEKVEIDLLLEGVKCRQTDAIWTRQEIKSSSIERRVVGVTGSVNSNVVSKELLIAMKLHSGRDPDLRDAIMIMDNADWNSVAILSIRGTKRKVVAQLRNELESLKKPEFEQGLRAYFGSRDRQDNRIVEASEKIALVMKRTKESQATRENVRLL